MLAVALTLAPLLARWIPDIVGWLGGDDAENVAAGVVGVVQRAAGSTDLTAMAAVLQDPERGADIANGLARIAADREAKQLDAQTAEIVARMKDTSDARATTVALAQTRSPIAYLAPAVCSLIFGLFTFVVVAETLGYGGGNISDKTRALLDYLAIAAAGYAIGSSAGSASKDARQGAMMALATETPAPAQSRRLFGRT